MRIYLTSLAFVVTAVLVSGLNAQNVIKDFVINNPRRFSPDDPWTTGKIYYTLIGHGGFFYNCDGEECKRYSPYINWNCQPVYGCQRGHVHRTICEQIAEVKQRIRWGACYDDGSCNNCGQCAGCQLAARPDDSIQYELVEQLEELEQLGGVMRNLPPQTISPPESSRSARKLFNLGEIFENAVRIPARESDAVDSAAASAAPSSRQATRPDKNDQSFRMLRR